MRTDDLPLFQWTPPCRVVAFPLDKRVGRIRHVASKLLEKHGPVAGAYWRQTVTSMAGQMERAGIPKAEIDADLRAFFDAVQAEMVRLTYRGRRPSGGDAA